MPASYWVRNPVRFRVLPIFRFVYFCSPLPGTARNSLVFTRMACLMFFSSTPLRLFLDTYHDPPLPVGCSVMHHQAHIYCKKVSVL